MQLLPAGYAKRCPYRVNVQAGAAAGVTNQAIGHRCHSLACASGTASFVPRVNAALCKPKGDELCRIKQMKD
jgi:hypothetical protein